MRRILPLVSLILVGFAPLPFPRTVPRDLKLIQGDWDLVSAVYTKGPGIEPSRGGEMSPLNVAGSRMAHGLTAPGEVALDATTTPKRIDLKVKHGGADRYVRGIYRLRGDALDISWGLRDRPADFADSREGTFHFAYQRTKR
jgi:uncharacterized protein (TIGR03067 family)